MSFVFKKENDLFNIDITIPIKHITFNNIIITKGNGERVNIDISQLDIDYISTHVSLRPGTFRLLIDLILKSEQSTPAKFIQLIVIMLKCITSRIAYFKNKSVIYNNKKQQKFYYHFIINYIRKFARTFTDKEYLQMISDLEKDQFKKR